jgi:hypothetical protein
MSIKAEGGLICDNCGRELTKDELLAHIRIEASVQRAVELGEPSEWDGRRTCLSCRLRFEEELPDDTENFASVCERCGRPAVLIVIHGQPEVGVCPSCREREGE